jgi:hypothetical protein
MKILYKYIMVSGLENLLHKIKIHYIYLQIILIEHLVVRLQKKNHGILKNMENQNMVV